MPGFFSSGGLQGVEDAEPPTPTHSFDENVAAPSIRRSVFVQADGAGIRAFCGNEVPVGWLDPRRWVCGSRAPLPGCHLRNLIYGYPTAKSFETELPFLMPIHDLQHRLQPHLEYLYLNACRHGLALLA